MVMADLKPAGGVYDLLEAKNMYLWLLYIGWCQSFVICSLAGVASDGHLDVGSL